MEKVSLFALSHLQLLDCLHTCHVHQVTHVRLYGVERVVVEHLVEVIRIILHTNHYMHQGSKME